MSHNTFFVIGIDAATLSFIKSNLSKFRSFQRLLKVGRSKEIILMEKPISASVWCGMFSGKTKDEHKHEKYVVDGKILRREDIQVDFIWDIIFREGKDVRVLNVPFVVPPYSFQVDYRPVAFGLPSNEKEWEMELENVTYYSKKLLAQEPDLLISVYTFLDRIQHFHWGEDCVVEWYKRLDEKIGELLLDSGFVADENNRLIVISDHGFCSFGEAKIRTLPEETKYGKLKGDHSEKAMLITLNVDYDINRPQDVFLAIKGAMY